MPEKAERSDRGHGTGPGGPAPVGDPGGTVGPGGPAPVGDPGGTPGAADQGQVSDREHWNGRYRAGRAGSTPLLLGRDLHLLPRSGRALDVAGGSGEAAVVLAARGLDVTVVDVSDVALERAQQLATDRQMRVTTIRADLAAEPLPAGPWDLITCFNYLDRALFPAFAEGLAPGGTLAVTIATRTNLERHDRPGPRFCLDDGELPGLLGDLELVLYREGWTLEGRHLAEAIARRV